MNVKNLITALAMVTCGVSYAQTATITIDAKANLKAISPWIYGKNNCLSDDPANAVSASQWKFYKEAGLRFVRENGGNNATKYNWRRKLSSHPDWYNNVYKHNWDYTAQQLQANLPETSGMFAFQLIGKVAANTNNNFGDWNYNNSQWWDGVAQNLAGGGIPNAGGGEDATVEGNTDLYLMDWPADSTVAILDHWFGQNGLGLQTDQFTYWSMDNEPEIWGGTHDDVYPEQPTAEELMQKYFAVAKKARALYPGIKLCGPVTCNEWQWYNYDSKRINSGGKSYSWLEFFIKRIAEEQQATGIRLLDVIDLHFYPGENNDADVVQLHRVFFDKNFNYPGANGVKTINGGWDNNMTKEYVFERCREWLDKYMGAGHGVTFGLTELGFNDKSATVNAVTYASILGTFANNGVEIFTPWSWRKGMWETLHLFSRYSREMSCSAVSSDENNLSAYTSVSRDSMTVIVVNRSVTKTISAQVNISNSTISDGSYKTLQLKDIPSSESFKSHTNNALKSGEVVVNGGSFTLTAPPLSITAVLLKADTKVTSPDMKRNSGFKVWQNDSGAIFFSYSQEKEGLLDVCLLDMNGRKVENHSSIKGIQGTHHYPLTSNKLNSGVYILQLKNEYESLTQKIMVR
jgi:hypothetical protein